MANAKFTGRAARKIKATVAKVSKMSADLRGRKPGTPDRRPGFWIELTAEGAGDDVGWYSWKRVYPAGGNPIIWDDEDPPVTGDLSAREANGRSGLAATEPARHFVTSIGYDPEDEDEKPLYIFHAGALPTGQIQHQAYVMVTQNAAGWSQRLAVPDLVEVEE